MKEILQEMEGRLVDEVKRRFAEEERQPVWSQISFWTCFGVYIS